MKYRSKKHLEAARKKRRIRLALIVLIVIALFTGAYFITRNQNFEIKKVVVTGAETIDVSKIEKEIYFILDDTTLFFLANRANFIFPEWKAEEVLKEKIKRINTVDIDVSGDAVNVEVTEKLPFLILCESTDVALGSCSAADSNGFLIGLYNSELQEIFPNIPKVVKDNTEAENLSEEEMLFLVDLIDEQNQYSIESRYFIIENETLSAYYKNDYSHIRFLIHRPLREQIKALEVAVNKFPAVISSIDDYWYIDLRFDDKVYINKNSESAMEYSEESESDMTSEIGESFSEQSTG